PDEGFLRRARRLLGELAALLLVLRNAARVAIVVRVHRGLVAAQGCASDEGEEVNETPCGSMHGSLPSPTTLLPSPRRVTRREAISSQARALSLGTALSTRSSQFAERASQQVEEREERRARGGIDDGRLGSRSAVQELPAGEPRPTQDVLQVGGGAIREV